MRRCRLSCDVPGPSLEVLRRKMLQCRIHLVDGDTCGSVSCCGREGYAKVMGGMDILEDVESGFHVAGGLMHEIGG